MPSVLSSSLVKSEKTPLLTSTVVSNPNTESSNVEKSDNMSFMRTMSFCIPFIIPDTPFLKFVGVMSMVCITGYKACLLVPGLSMKIVIDALASEDARTRLRVPIFGVFLYLAGRVGGAIFGQGQEVSQEYCSQHLSRRFAIRSFAHLQALSLTYHTRQRTGETTSILGRGIKSINILLRLIIFSLLPTVIEAFVVSSIFFKLGSPTIALATVVTVFLYIGYTAYITKWRVRYGREVREAENNAWSRATESILHYSTVKSFGMDEEEVRRYDSLWGIVQQTAFKAKGMISAFNVSSNLIVQFGTFVGLLIAAHDAGMGRISAGDFILVQSYIGQLFGPLLWMGRSYGQVISALTNIEQVMELFDTVPDIQDAPNAVDVQCTGSSNSFDIEFKNVTFLYEETERDNSGGVRNVSFHIPADKMVALVGMSGAGKSTIVRLLLRLYDAHEGQVLVNGTDIRSIKQNSLRHTIGLVAQDTVLFNDTLRNNICYGRPTANDAEIWDAIRMAALTDFVQKQPLQLETIVGEQGTRLSGGERQRVGIARAVLKKPGIMILDESTSALSTIDERKIQGHLQAVCERSTILAVAHRLSTIMHADEILVFSNGSIVERGCHKDLVSLNGTYACMWKAQAGEE